MTPSILTLTVATLIAAAPEIEDARPDENPPEKEDKRDLTLALLETAGFVAFGSTWYFVDYQANAHDWDFEFSADTFAKKLSFDYVRFENNNFYHNAFGHVIAGSFYYNGWRGNGYTALESFLAATILSTFWEFVIEYREVASINDLIISPFGGLTMGEAFHQNAKVLLSQPPNFVRSLLAALMDPPLFFQRYFDERDHTPPYRMVLSASFGANQFTGGGGARTLASFAFDSEIFDAIAYGEGGPERGWQLDTPYTAFSGNVALGQGRGALDLRFRATHVMLGYLARFSSEPDPDAGSSVFIGLASAFEHATRRLPDRTDRYGVADLVGPFFNIDAQWKGVRLWGRAEAYFDFGVVNAFALDTYARDHDITNTKSSIRDRRYYYGIGGALMVSGGFDIDGVRLSGGYRIFAMDSVEGRDRFQEEVTNDFSLFDRRDVLAAELAYEIVPGAIEMSVGGELVRFEGRIDDVTVVEWQRRVVTGVGILL